MVCIKPKLNKINIGITENLKAKKLCDFQGISKNNPKYSFQFAVVRVNKEFDTNLQDYETNEENSLLYFKNLFVSSYLTY